MNQKETGFHRQRAEFEDPERLMHLLTDIRIMQAQVDALEHVMSQRLASSEVVDLEERQRIDLFIVKVAHRLKQKASNLDVALGNAK